MRYRGHFFAIYVFLPLVAAALWGCGKLAVQHPGEGHAGPVGSLEIVVENFVGEEPRRTIAPDQLTVQQLAGTGYTLKLSGTTGRMSLPERALTLTNGRASLGDIPVGLWELTLTAYDGNSVAVLQGKATHQVRQVGGGEVSFLLTPAGVTGTGTLNLTLNFSATDRALLQSNTGRDRHWRIALYYPGTDTMVANTEASWSRLASSQDQSFNYLSLTYRGGPSNTTYNLPAGEYELRFRMWGGGLPEGNTLMWKDNLYVEPGRQTVATITVPQLSYKPAAPTGFYCLADNYTNSYGVLLNWNPVYNADRYELQVKSFTSGAWSTYNDTSWNSLSGGTVFSYSTTGANTPRSPVPDGGSLYGDSDTYSLQVTRSASNVHYVARIRSVNAYGFSNWTYLQNLMNPSPTIITASNSRVSNTQRAVNVTIGNVDYETRYQMEFYNLRGTAANLFDVINNNDAEWENYRPANTANIGSMQVYKNSGTYFYNDSQATPQVLFKPFNNNNNLCFRIRAVVTIGGTDAYSPWAYYTSVINTGQ